MKRKNRKKPYVIKKHEAVLKSDPIANWYRIEDEKTHTRELNLSLRLRHRPGDKIRNSIRLKKEIDHYKKLDS